MIAPAATRSRREPHRDGSVGQISPPMFRSPRWWPGVVDRHPAWLPWGNFSDPAAIAGSAGTVGRAAVRSDHRVLLGRVHTGVKENRHEQCDYFFIFFLNRTWFLLPRAPSHTNCRWVCGGGSSLYVDGRT